MKRKIYRQKRKESRMNYHNLLNNWLDFIKTKVKETTYVRYQHLIYQHISPFLGKYYVDELNVSLIDHFMNQKLQNGRLDKKGGLSIKTASDILILIKTTLQYAKNHQIAMNCCLSLLKIKPQEKKIMILTEREQFKLVTYLLEELNLYKLGILLSLYTGIRIGELCALKWENIDLIDKKIYINQTIQRISNFEKTMNKQTKIIFSSPKSYCSIREIPLPEFLVTILSRFQTDAKYYVLSCKNKYVEPRVMQYQFKKQITQCGLPSSYSFHCLRHTFATRCVEMGFEIKSLSEILGHSNVNITLNRYVHSSFELKMQQMNKLKLFQE